MRSFWSGGRKRTNDASEDEPPHPFDAPAAGTAPALTIVQQRRLLRLKSARLALAQKRRCSPQRIAPDALLQQLALNDPLSPEALDSLFASHDIHDRAVTQSLLTIVQRELQSA